MNYRFIHQEGYEASIKDLESFIDYINAGSIKESTMLYDEINFESMRADQVEDFNNIFKEMRKNGWAVYAVAKPIEKTHGGIRFEESREVPDFGDNENINNLLVFKESNSKNIIDKEFTDSRDNEIDLSLESKFNQNQRILKSIKTGLSNSSNRILTIIAIVISAYSIVILTVANPEFADFVYIMNERTFIRLFGSILISTVISFVLWKIFFRNDNISWLLFFSVILLLIASIFFVQTMDAKKDNEGKIYKINRYLNK